MSAHPACVATASSVDAVCDAVCADVEFARHRRLNPGPIDAGTYPGLPGLLAPLGLALENMGDIDIQTIADTTSTETHGTGESFGARPPSTRRSPRFLPTAPCSPSAQTRMPSCLPRRGSALASCGSSAT